MRRMHGAALIATPGSSAPSLLDAMNNAQKQLKVDAARSADELDVAWELKYAGATGGGGRLRAMQEPRTEGDEAEPSDWPAAWSASEGLEGRHDLVDQLRSIGPVDERANEVPRDVHQVAVAHGAELVNPAVGGLCLDVVEDDASEGLVW